MKKLNLLFPMVILCSSAVFAQEELSHITDVSYYQSQKIQNMASYIYKVYIGKDYYVNYADGAPRSSPPTGVLGRAGKNTGNSTLTAFASYLFNNDNAGNTKTTDMYYTLYKGFAWIFNYPRKNERLVYKAPTLSWFPVLQVVTAWDSSDNFDGFFFSAKGGHNHDSHNHNTQKMRFVWNILVF